MTKFWDLLLNSALGPGLLLVGIVLLAYIPALRAGFVWDDTAVTENVLLRTVRGLWQIWTLPSGIPHEGHYWPLVYSSFWVDYRLWGLNPIGYHLTNVLLHAVNCILLWLLLRRLAVPGAWLAAGIFALHPVHVESIAWVIERKDVLSGMFYLLAFTVYIRFQTRRNWRAYALALGLFVCAMLSKSITISLPLAILLYIWWKRRSLNNRDWLPLLPFVAVAVIITALDLVWHIEMSVPMERGLSFPDRFLLAGRVLWFYARKLVWPSNLMTIYPRWEISPLAIRQYVYPLAAAAVLVVLWLKREKWGKAPLVAVLYFVITLGPLLGFVDFGFMEKSFVADRFQYLASAGPIALFAAIVTKITSRFGKTEVLTPISAALLLALGILTWRQTSIYKDQETLFRHSLAGNPNSPTAHYNLGKALERQRRYQEAIVSYSKALALRPDDADTHNSLGISLSNEGDLEGALAHFAEAVQLEPDNLKAHNNLGIALIKKGRLDEARGCFIKALRISPEYAEAHKNLGIVFTNQGKIEKAIFHFEEALKINPDYAQARTGLAVARAKKRKARDALSSKAQPHRNLMDRSP